MKKFKEKTALHQETYKAAFEVMFARTQRNKDRWAHWEDLTMDKILAYGNHSDPEDEQPVKDLSTRQRFGLVDKLVSALNDCRDTV